jgi:hypothetical protein
LSLSKGGRSNPLRLKKGIAALACGSLAMTPDFVLAFLLLNQVLRFGRECN